MSILICGVSEKLLTVSSLMLDNYVILLNMWAIASDCGVSSQNELIRTPLQSTRYYFKMSLLKCTFLGVTMWVVFGTPSCSKCDELEFEVSAEL